MIPFEKAKLLGTPFSVMTVLVIDYFTFKESESSSYELNKLSNLNTIDGCGY